MKEDVLCPGPHTWQLTPAPFLNGSHFEFCILLVSASPVWVTAPLSLQQYGLATCSPRSLLGSLDAATEMDPAPTCMGLPVWCGEGTMMKGWGRRCWEGPRLQGRGDFSDRGPPPLDRKDRTEAIWQGVEGCSRGREQHSQGPGVLKGTKALNLIGHNTRLNTHTHS